MQCLQLTRGEPPATTVDVALSGDFHSSYGYVTIDGATYTSAQTLKVAKGTSVTVYCSPSYATNAAEIKLNGTTVAQGTYSNPVVEYTFAVTDNCSIVMTKTGSTKYYFTAAITMPA